MKLNLIGELKVIPAFRIVIDGRIKGGSKTVPTGFKVVITTDLHETYGTATILLAGPYNSREAAEAVKTRLAGELAHLEATT